VSRAGFALKSMIMEIDNKSRINRFQHPIVVPVSEMPPNPCDSRASAAFKVSIHDAEDLLWYFEHSGQPPPPKAEVLKRAGLVMALTAWETYVEDRVREEVEQRWGSDVEGNTAGQLLQAKLEQELRCFNTPNAGNTRKLFRDYVGVDVTTGWSVLGQGPLEVKKRLSELIKKRGEAVHRAKPVASGQPSPPHLVTKEELKRHIRFLKELVKETDAALGGRVAEAGKSKSMNAHRASTAVAAA
jgi:hypothetical protein